MKPAMPKIDFASGKIWAEEFYDYNVELPESKNLISAPQFAQAIGRLRPKLTAFIKTY